MLFHRLSKLWKTTTAILSMPLWWVFRVASNIFVEEKQVVINHFANDTVTYCFGLIQSQVLILVAWTTKLEKLKMYRMGLAILAIIQQNWPQLGIRLATFSWPVWQHFLPLSSKPVKLLASTLHKIVNQTNGIWACSNDLLCIFI